MSHSGKYQLKQQNEEAMADVVKTVNHPKIKPTAEGEIQCQNPQAVGGLGLLVTQ